MAAEPHDAQPPQLQALEARVSELEHRAENVTPQALAATNYAVSLVHADTQALRERVDWISQVQEEHGGMLREILRRLPPADDGD